MASVHYAACCRAYSCKPLREILLLLLLLIFIIISNCQWLKTKPKNNAEVVTGLDGRWQ